MVNLTFRFSTLRQRFKPLSSEGHHLLSSLLMYDPARRVSADQALEHQYFKSITVTLGWRDADDQGESSAQTPGSVCLVPFSSGW